MGPHTLKVVCCLFLQYPLSRAVGSSGLKSPSTFHSFWRAPQVLGRPACSYFKLGTLIGFWRDGRPDMAGAPPGLMKGKVRLNMSSMRALLGRPPRKALAACDIHAPCWGLPEIGGLGWGTMCWDGNLASCRRPRPHPAGRDPSRTTTPASNPHFATLVRISATDAVTAAASSTLTLHARRCYRRLQASLY